MLQSSDEMRKRPNTFARKHDYATFIDLAGGNFLLFEIFHFYHVSKHLMLANIANFVCL